MIVYTTSWANWVLIKVSGNVMITTSFSFPTGWSVTQRWGWAEMGSRTLSSTRSSRPWTGTTSGTPSHRISQSSPVPLIQGTLNPSMRRTPQHDATMWDSSSFAYQLHCSVTLQCCAWGRAVLISQWQFLSGTDTMIFKPFLPKDKCGISLCKPAFLCNTVFPRIDAALE